MCIPFASVRICVWAINLGIRHLDLASCIPSRRNKIVQKIRLSDFGRRGARSYRFADSDKDVAHSTPCDEGANDSKWFGLGPKTASE